MSYYFVLYILYCAKNRATPDAQGLSVYIRNGATYCFV